MSLAEVVELEPKLREGTQPEVYAHSLSTLRKLGHVAVEPTVDVEYKETILDLAFDDFATAEAEMLKTDKELGEQLEINNIRTHVVIDNKVRARDGQPMVDVLRNGALASARMAKEDARYKGQATRDKIDEEVGEDNDKLLPGQTLWGVSFAAQKDLIDYPEIYDKKFGYKEFLVYVQTYSMNDNGTLTTGSFSFEVTDKDKFRALLEENGMVIPEDESDNTWLKHRQVIQATSAEAHSFVKRMRVEYNKRINRVTNKHSVTKYMESSEKVLRRLFDHYYVPLAEAVYTGKNNEVLRGFAQTVHENNNQLKSDIRQQLMRISNSNFLSDEDGILLDSVIRYAVAEEMRKGLAESLKSKAKTTNQIQIKPHEMRYMHSAPINVDQLLAQNIRTGIAEKRSYGGCPGNIDLAEKSVLGGITKEEIMGIKNINPQEAYGGKFEGDIPKEKWEWKIGVCIIKDCKTRPGKTKVGPCSICKNCTERDDRGEKLEKADDIDVNVDEKEGESSEGHIIKLFERKKYHELSREHQQPEAIAA